MIPRISVDEFDRDRRITALERQVLVLSGQIAARDAAISQLIKEMVSLQSDTAMGFVDQYPQMLAEIDTKVLSAIAAADEDEPESSSEFGDKVPASVRELWS